MKIEVNLQKKYILGILISFVLVTAISLTYAYNTNWASAPGNPAIMGHSPDEIVGNLLCGTGQALTITSTGWSCVSTGGSSVTNNYALPAGYAEVYVNAGQDTSTLTLANTTSAPQDTCGNNGPFTTVAYTGNGTGYYTSSSIYNPFGQYQEINRTQGAGQYICGVTENKTCVNVYLDHILGSQTYYDVSTVQCKQAKALVRYLNPPIPGKVVNLSLLTYGGGACALINDSTVKCAGYNQYGELGNGNNYNSYVFTSVLNLNNVVQIVSDDVYACALKNDGTVWCW